MKYYRSFPDVIPPGRNYVVDQLPRLTTHGADLRTCAEPYPEGNFTLLEWDLAVSKEDLDIWEWDCQNFPSSIIVAPYRLYPVSTGLHFPMWAHTLLRDGEDYRNGMDAVKESDPNCDFFSFGMIYFPYWVWSEFLRTTDKAWNDTEFSIWHWEKYHKPTWIDWHVRPVHLHYVGDAITSNQPRVG